MSSFRSYFILFTHSLSQLIAKRGKQQILILIHCRAVKKLIEHAAPSILVAGVFCNDNGLDLQVHTHPAVAPIAVAALTLGGQLASALVPSGHPDVAKLTKIAALKILAELQRQLDAAATIGNGVPQ